MKRFARLNYDSFTIEGEVNEQLPLYTNFLENVYPLDGSCRNMFPDFYIFNGDVKVGDQSKMLLKQNITISNQEMNFSKNENSFIELNGDLFDSTIFDIIIDFKLSNIDTDQSLLTSDNLIIGFDSNNKKLYMEFLDPKGEFSTAGDLLNHKFSICNEDDILKNEINNLTIHRFNKTILITLNRNKTKLLILKASLDTNNIYLGKGFDGVISSFGIKDISYNESENVIIPSNSTMSDFSISFKLDKIADNVNLLEIGSFILKINNDQLYINSTSISDALIERNLYGVSMAYSQNQIKIIVCDMEKHTTIVNKTIDIAIQSNTILTKNNIGVLNLAIFSTRLKDEILIGLFNKRFSLDKSGNITYEINEIDGHNRLDVPVGEKYHMQLTQDLDSDCKTITTDQKVKFVSGGALSKDADKPLMLSFAEDIGLMNNWNIIYKKCITKLTLGKNYDSLGEGLYWGVEDNLFVIKYTEGQNIISSTINGLKAQEIMNEFIVLSISHQSSSVKFILCCSKGVFETTINKTIDDIGNDYYDLFLGGKEFSIYGEAIYRELTIVSNWIVSKEDIENMFRIKLSYEKNKLKSNVDIIEK